MEMQWLLLVLLLFAAVLPALLGSAVDSTQKTSRLVVVTATGLCLVAAFLERDRSLSLDQLPGMRPVEFPEGGYRGSDSCRVCHLEQHKSWHDSYHRSMTQLANEDSVLGDFDNVALSFDGLGYQLYRQGEQFMVGMEIENPQTGAVQLIHRPIVMTTGSHHMQIYWFSLGYDQSRSLGMLPFAYLVKEQRWIPRHAAFLMPPERSREIVVGRWNATCVRCHSTDPEAHADNPNAMLADTTAAEFGISCEACHGPGDPHLAANANPLRRYLQRLGGTPDLSITNPSRLDHQLGSQVCGLCHSVSSIKQEADFARWHEEGYDFRPGQALRGERHLVQATQPEAEMTRKLIASYPHFLEDSFWSDGMLRVTGREYTALLDTPCHQKGQLSCMSCHEMHWSEQNGTRESWRDDQLKAGMRGNQACVSCHSQYSAPQQLASHTHHQADSSGSNCYNCHMPHTSYGLLKAVRSHQVDSPNVAVTLKTGRPNACNQCHLDKPLGWTADQLEKWYGHESPRLSTDQRQVAASVTWLLSGDAGQRALAAWTYSWPPALEASGNDWQAPLLSWLFEDPYQAVAFIAGRSLHSLPGYENLGYDFLGSESHRQEKRRQVQTIWQQRPQSAQLGTSVLVDKDGKLMLDEIERLYFLRDDRRINLTE